MPSYAYEGDAGLDLHTVESYTLKPGEKHVFPTGLAIKLPEGYTGLIWDKGGIAAKWGITTIGGVFDSNYTGEYLIALVNLSDDEHHFEKGDKICQLLIQSVATATIEEVDSLDKTVRGDNRFGSSGK